jgi:hypothetical protein
VDYDYSKRKSHIWREREASCLKALNRKVAVIVIVVILGFMIYNLTVNEIANQAVFRNLITTTPPPTQTSRNATSPKSGGPLSCGDFIMLQLKRIDPTINKAKALSLAETAPEYLAAILLTNVQYNQGQFYDYRFNTTTCQITSLMIGEAFALSMGGACVGRLEIWVNQELTGVVATRWYIPDCERF